MPRRFHRILGAVMVLPFVLWTATGLAFLVKPGWGGAYESLDAFRDEPFDPMGVASVALVASKPGEPDAASRIELGTTAIGLLYRVSGDGRTRLVDARTGTPVSPIDARAARTIAEDAASRARASARYGAVTDVRESDDAVDVAFAGGATIRVGRDDLRLSQSGADTRRIDALYRIHYLQWTGVAAIDRPLAVAAIAGTWVLASLGIVLIRKRS